MNIIEIKTDNRYKNGNVKLVKGKLRGNSKTMEMTRPQVEMLRDTYEDYYRTLQFNLNPPIVVGHELGEAIKDQLSTNNKTKE